VEVLGVWMKVRGCRAGGALRGRAGFRCHNAIIHPAVDGYMLAWVSRPAMRVLRDRCECVTTRGRVRTLQLGCEAWKR